ncbi:MAG: HAD family hydrolase [Methanotrichaceae archaeon]|jgi:putative hydrolase of the HAD superfamily
MIEREGLQGINGILFDCYKTLIDIVTDEDDKKTYESVSNWLIYQGVRITPDQLKSEYKGSCLLGTQAIGQEYPEIRVEKTFEVICKQNSLWDIDEKTLGEETARAFRSASLRRLQVFPQSVRLLDELKEYPLGVVSNGQRVFSEIELRYLNLFDHFKSVIFSSDLGFKKPDPRIFLAGARALGLNEKEVLYIGDNFENDIIPSVKLGMKSMHIEEAWRFFKVI